MLLEVLDFEKRRMTAAPEEYSIIEYQIYSTGEIIIPFIGDSEHSTLARHILNDFPFILFSSSTPCSNHLPQKLTVTFASPNITKIDEDHFHLGGEFPDEIASDFVAFLSLYTRRRLFPGGITRIGNLPISEQADTNNRIIRIRQLPREIDTKDFYALLSNLQKMDRKIAETFILSMRLYYYAVNIMYSDPEFSYLLLIICLETIASIVNEKYMPNNIENYLDSRFSGWKEIHDHISPALRNNLIQLLLRNEHFTLKKVQEFVLNNLPEKFWLDTIDDAKTDYLYGIIDGDGEHYKKSDKIINEYEKITRDELQKVLQTIYNARSKLVHTGKRFPASISIGLYEKYNPEVFTDLLKNPNKKLEIPTVLTFERLVSYSMIEYLRKK